MFCQLILTFADNLSRQAARRIVQTISRIQLWLMRFSRLFAGLSF